MECLNKPHGAAPNDREMDRETTISFTAADAKMLADLLDKPPAPNDALRRAFERYRNMQITVA